MDRMDIGECIPLDEKVAKSVSCIASKHFHSSSVKRFTVRRDPKTGVKKLWRKNDIKKEVNNEYNSRE